jgi:Lrp/AsnC family leucine-responsive transcriptional regulator
MNIDKIDNKIIVELLNNCRKTNLEIGKKAGLSREGVANRIRKLEAEQIITGYGIDINFGRLGFLPHEVAIKLQHMTIEKTNSLTDYFKKNKKIIFVERVLGKYDYLIMLLAKSMSELDSELELMREKIGDNLKSMAISAWIANYDTASSFFSKNPVAAVSRQTETAPLEVDDTEKRLINELALNSKASCVNLAKKLGISAITVANKIKYLQREQAIKTIRAKIDFEKLGVHRYALFLNVTGGKESMLAEYCKNQSNIADFTKFLGEYNYSIEIFAKNNEEFKKTVDEIITVFQKVIVDHEELILLEEIKHTPGII